MLLTLWYVTLFFRYFVMGIRPPELQFTLSVVLERRAYLTENGSVWETVSTLKIGPQKRIAVSDTHQVSSCHYNIHSTDYKSFFR